MPDDRDLMLTTVAEHGVYFATGVPATFDFMRNTERSPRHRRGTEDRYQQRIEPAGRYVITVEHDAYAPPRGWVRGTTTVRNPLVLRFSAHGIAYDDTSWKARLARHFRARGRALSAKLRALGYDAIVTVQDDSGHGASVSETVLL